MSISPRKLWGALAAKYAYKLRVRPVKTVFIHHGASFAKALVADLDGDGIPDVEEQIWRAYQRYHMVTRRWSDIAYNFGVGLSGSVLKGRGWTRQGGATGSPQDGRSLSICAIGNFDVQKPSTAMIDAISNWILTGIEKGHIHPDVVIKGHRDKPYSTACPGRYLYAKIPQIRSMVAAGRTEDIMQGLPTDQTWIDDVKDSPDGHRSEAVRLWQFALVEWGYMALPKVDGIKGPGTRDAHKKWETDQGYATPNGKPGKVSWPKLLGGPGVLVTPTKPDLSALSGLASAFTATAGRLQAEVDRLSK